MDPDPSPLRRYVAARWGAPPSEPLRCGEAADDLAAARALVPDLTATAALPASSGSGLRFAVSHEAEWLVVEAEQGLAAHGAFWAGFHRRERAQFLAAWLVLRASPGLLTRPPPRPRAQRRSPTARR